MKKIKPLTKLKQLTDDEDEVRELRSADFQRFRQAQGILPPPLLEKLDVRGGSAQQTPDQQAPGKERVTIRLSRDVVERFRATGEGWQTRLDAALRDWLQTHSPG